MIKQIPKISFKENVSEKLTGFELISLKALFSEKLHPSDHNPFKPHKLVFYALLFISSGKVQHQIDFKKISVAAGDCLIISKNQVHAFDDKAVYDGYLVLFTEEFLINYLSPSTLAKISRLYNYHFGTSLYHTPKESDHFVLSLQEELSGANYDGKPNMIAAGLSIFLLQVERINQLHSNDNSFDRGYEIFIAFKQQVEEEYRTSRDAKWYAEKAIISYKHLNDVCKRFTQMTAKEFIDEHVILEAKRYLSVTSLSVKEIGYECGFDEPTNFQKYFKKHTGLTPLAFREKYQ